MKTNNSQRCKTVFCYVIQTLILFISGGLIYNLVENIFRGYSHFSMFVLGGIDFILIGAINEHLSQKFNLFYQSLIGASIITVSELVTGYIVNIRLNLNVWDYSNLPFNFLGQISLYYSLLWIPVSALAIILDDLLRLWLYDEKLPKYFTKRKSPE